MDIIRIGLELACGALTGYITNSIAVKMLFRNYGPFGGVIVKGRKEFIDNISLLVERDIIDKNTLAAILDQTVLNRWIEYFLEEALLSNIEGTLAADIPGIDQTMDNFTAFLNTNAGEYSRELYNILTNIKLEELIPEKQFEYFSEQQINRLLYYTGNSTEVKEQFSMLFSGINNKNLNLLFTHKMINTLTENTLNRFRDFRKETGLISKLLDPVLRKTCICLDIEGICGELIRIIERKKLKDYKIDEKYLSAILEKAVSFINSPSGNNFILSTSQRIMKSIKKEQLTIGAYLKSETGKNTAGIIDRKIDGTLNILADWINENQKRIDSIFEQTLLTVFDKEAHQSGWKALVKKNIYKYYLKKSQLLASARLLAASLSDPLLKYSLKNRILNEMDKALEIIIDEKGDSGRAVIFFNKYLNTLKQKKSAFITESPLADFIDLAKLKPDSLCNNNFIVTQMGKRLLSGLEKGIENVGAGDISTLFQSRLAEEYYRKIISILKNNEDYLKGGLEKLYKNWKDKTLAQVMNHTENLSRKPSLDWIRERVKNIKKLELKRVTAWINRNTGIYEKKGEKLTDHFLKELPELFQGKISSLIRNNLNSITDDNLKNMLEKLISRELKAITYFGAFLGIFSALFIYLLRINMGVSSFWQLPVSILVYGAIGYITNVIAIKMIFRPYEKKKLLGLPLPFTPGVISKEKDRFALSIGNFIDRELFNAGAIKNTLQERKEQILSFLKEILSRKGYQLPRELLLKNKKNIISLIAENKEMIIKETAGLACAAFPAYSSVLAANLENYFTESSSNIAREIYQLLDEKRDYPLSAILPGSPVNGIVYSINTGLKRKIDDYCLLLEDNNLFESALKHHLDEYYESIKDYQAGGLSVEVRNSISGFLYNMLVRTSISMSPGLKVYINKLIHSKTKLFLKKAPELVEANRSRLKSEIKRRFRARLGFWARAGKLVDIDLTLDEFTDTFIKEGLPGIINGFLDERSGDIMRELELSTEEVSLIIEELFNNKEISKVVSENINFLIDNSSLTMKDILGILDLERPSLLLDIFSEELSFLREKLAENLKDNRKYLQEEYGAFIRELLEQFMASTKLKSLLANIDQDLIRESLVQLMRELNNSGQFHDFVTVFLKVQLSPEQTDDIFRKDYLEQDLNGLFNNLLKDGELPSFLEEIYQKLVETLAEIIDKKTADYIIDIIVKSIFNTLENGLPQLVDEVDIKNIAVEQIKNMDARKIEDLFYSFAGNYFTKLEHYGWLGAFFGLLAALINLII
ncbi:MAG: DUF445 family protein [Halanaerobiaceae bacterium]|nr:DUF445 family protein [Halanaerobiaceae bacterium]